MFSCTALLAGCVCSTGEYSALMDRNGDVMCVCVCVAIGVLLGQVSIMLFMTPI